MVLPYLATSLLPVIFYLLAGYLSFYNSICKRFENRKAFPFSFASADLFSSLEYSSCNETFNLIRNHLLSASPDFHPDIPIQLTQGEKTSL